MELKGLEQNENPLFKRKAITATVFSEITPSKKEIKDQIAKKISSKPELIIVEGIHGRFGSKEFKITANVYASEEDLRSTEPRSKKEEIPGELASAAEPTPEIQPEDKPEEAKE